MKTSWIDTSDGENLRSNQVGLHEKGNVSDYIWLESRLSGNELVHVFMKGAITPKKPELNITIWREKDSENVLKATEEGTKEAGSISGYRLVGSKTENGITIHEFEKDSEQKPSPARSENPSIKPSPAPSENPSTRPSQGKTTKSVVVPSSPQISTVPQSPAQESVAQIPEPTVVPIPEDNEQSVDGNRILKKKDIQSLIPKTGDKGMDTMIKLSIVSILSVFGLLVLKFKKKETEEK